MQTTAVRRLANQHIGQARFHHPVEVVAWLGALQGQDYLGALWSVGVRLPGIREGAVEQALDDTHIVRSWLMRGTLHLTAAADLRWMLLLFGPRMIAASARRYQELELDEATFARSNDLLAGALRDGSRQTRSTLLDLLRRNGIATTGQRAPHLLQRAALDGLICQAAARRNDPTYLSLDALPPAARLNREEALAELARRYFFSRGPATLQDFTWWSGLLAADTRAGLEAARADLVEETAAGQTSWRGPAEPHADIPAPAVFLLPGFDEYLVGYRDRSAMQDEARTRAYPKNGMLPPNIVVDGWVCGHWKRTLRKNQVLIHYELFRPLEAAEQAALQAAAAQYGAYLGREALLTQAGEAAPAGH